MWAVCALFVPGPWCPTWRDHTCHVTYGSVWSRIVWSRIVVSRSVWRLVGAPRQNWPDQLGVRHAHTWSRSTNFRISIPSSSPQRSGSPPPWPVSPPTGASLDMHTWSRSVRVRAREQRPARGSITTHNRRSSVAHARAASGGDPRAQVLTTRRRPAYRRETTVERATPNRIAVPYCSPTACASSSLLPVHPLSRPEYPRTAYQSRNGKSRNQSAFPLSPI